METSFVLNTEMHSLDGHSETQQALILRNYNKFRYLWYQYILKFRSKAVSLNQIRKDCDHMIKTCWYIDRHEIKFTYIPEQFLIRNRF